MSRHSVSMSGGSPWGFRLYGGGGDPLVVAKLRRRSKASESGLEEGDILLAINQYSTQNMSHPVAMALVDQATDGLAFEVIRGADSHAVDAALQSLGSQYQAPPTSAPAGATQAPPSNGFQNGYSLSPRAASPRAPSPRGSPRALSPAGNTVRQQQTFNDGNTQRQVTTETSTQKFGGTTLTKVTREEVSSTAYGSPRLPAATGYEAKVAPAPRKPNTWAPVGPPRFGPAAQGMGQGGGGPTVRAPPGVQVSQNPDQSVTLTLGLGDNQSPNNLNLNNNKENRGPSPSRPYVPPSQASTNQNMFRIQKLQTTAPKAIWTPSFIPDLPERGPSERTNLMDDMPDYNFQPEPAPAPQPEPEPEPQFQPLPSALRPATDESEHSHLLDTKKVYADSAFFDDSEHKYPTIEEQIKMARKVALSLESPANQKARGHKMFIKRKQKAYRWVAGEGGAHEMQEIVSGDEESEEKYYKSDPWNTQGHTWQPNFPPQASQGPPARGPSSIPAPPPLTDFNWNKPMYKAPTLNFTGSKKEIEEKSNALSQDEFERMRMFEQKVQHNKISPSVSFKIAEDLHNLKGKGAKLFAKRKAKSEEWVVEDKQQDSRRNDPAFLAKVTGGQSMLGGLGGLFGGAQANSPPAAPTAPSRPRLQEMIDPPKAAMTPWDAAASGRIDQAFDHLDDYMKAKRGGAMKATQLTLAAKLGGAPLGGGAPSGNNSARKIQPWDQQGSSSASSPASTPQQRPQTPPDTFSTSSSSSSMFTSSQSTTSKLKPWSSTTALNKRPALPSMSTASPGFSVSSSTSSSAAAPGGYRPVKFKAPGSSQIGRFDAAPHRRESEPVGGFCDL